MSDEPVTTRERDRNGKSGKAWWLDHRRNVDRLAYGLYALCAVLLLVDPLIHKHSPFAIEHWIGFYGIYGLVACAAFIFAAVILRRALKRPEDYYDG